MKNIIFDDDKKDFIENEISFESLETTIENYIINLNLKLDKKLINNRVIFFTDKVEGIKWRNIVYCIKKIRYIEKFDGAIYIVNTHCNEIKYSDIQELLKYKIKIIKQLEESKEDEVFSFSSDNFNQVRKRINNYIKDFEIVLNEFKKDNYSQGGFLLLQSILMYDINVHKYKRFPNNTEQLFEDWSSYILLKPANKIYKNNKGFKELFNTNEDLLYFHEALLTNYLPISIYCHDWHCDL